MLMEEVERATGLPVRPAGSLYLNDEVMVREYSDV